LKLRDRDYDVTIIERNPAGRTYGWGVVFWTTCSRPCGTATP
jgi:hypothetical protein